MKRLNLNGKWKMTGAGYEVYGNVPGSVYSFLHVDNDILPDPFYRNNEEVYLKLAEQEFTFEKAFNHVKTNSQEFLVFEGLDTLCTIYLNGKEIAKTQNMHVAYRFDVSDVLAGGENHLKVVCQPIAPYIRQKQAENKLFGAMDCLDGYPHVRKAHCMMGWDWGPHLPDAGIWRGVYLLEKDSAEIKNIDIKQRHANGEVYLCPIVKVDKDVQISVCLTSPNGEKVELKANEENKISNPCLWMPNGFGEQNLYKVEIKIAENGVVVDQKSLKIGLREMELVRQKDEFGESFFHRVNGIDIFAMGADYIPEDNIFARITKERTRELLTQCKNCNFNAIRFWGGAYYPDDFFFDICDELGLIVFFDLAFACSVYDPDKAMKESIFEEIKQNLTRIRHHACLGLICGNNEIEWHFDEYVAMSGRQDLEYLRGVYNELFEEKIPSLVKEIALNLAYIPSSPTSFAKFKDVNGESVGDCHDWEPDYTTIRNKHYRYVSEFGFQALPSYKTIKAFTEQEDRFLDSEVMKRHQRSYGGNDLILTYLRKILNEPNSLENLSYATQVLQAESIKYRVEHYRRNRGRCMGTLYWQLNDIWPVTSWASIDYYGRYKALQYKAKRFYSPLLLSCEERGEFESVNQASEFPTAHLCVTNDTLKGVNCIVKCYVKDSLGGVKREWQEEIFVPSLDKKWLDKAIIKDLDVKTEHLQMVLEIDGEIISEDCILFTEPKNHVFINPEITYNIIGDEIIVKANAFAKYVMLEGVDCDLILSDNFFDMEKGEKRVKILKGSATALTVKTLFDIQ